MYSIHEIKLKNFKATADIINRYYNGRQVVLYGDSLTLRKLLENEYGIKNILVATAIKERVGQNGFIDINSLKDLSSKYYIAVPFLKNNSKKRLISLGYLEFKDFVFTLHEPISIQPDFNGEYHDEYGNHIHCKGCRIYLKEDVANTNIFVDDSSAFWKNCCIYIEGSNANIKIGKNCTFKNNTTILIHPDANLTVGNNTSFGHDDSITVSRGNSLHIGNDCMFSYKIEFYSGDSHAVYDVKSRTRTNPISYIENPKNTIMIKDHVWIGFKAIILHNTIIEKSSIVGAGAVVKGKFPNNCVIAGNPAKIVKKDVTWNKSNLSFDIEDCNEEYIRLTEDL